MDTIKYRALLETISKGSLTKAARALGYSQPGISHMIRSLEQEFGFSLLQRGRECVQPTEDAKRILPYLRQIEQGERGLEEMVGRIAGIEQGTVRIGAFYSVSIHWLPQLISSFSEKFPGIEIELSEGNLGEVRGWLLREEVDLGFLSGPAPEGFDFLPLMEDPVMAVLPRDHALCRMEKIPAARLLEEPFIIPVQGSDEDVWRVLEAEGLGEPKIRYRIKGDEIILSMVAAGLGVALMPRLLAEQARSAVALRPLTNRHCRTLGVASQKQRRLSPAAQRFVLQVEERLAPKGECG